MPNQNIATKTLGGGINNTQIIAAFNKTVEEQPTPNTFKQGNFSSVNVGSMIFPIFKKVPLGGPDDLNLE